MSQHHIGAPTTEPFYTRMSLPYNPDDPASYAKGGGSIPPTHMKDVIDVSKVLYALNPVYSESVLGHISAIDFAQESLRLSTSFIAYSLLHAAERILSAIPVEVVAGPCYTPRGLNELDRCWALLLTVQTPDSKHATCLVPVQLNMEGGAAIRHIYTEHKTVLPWDMPISLLNASQSWHLYALAIPNYTDIYIKSHDMPALYCEDVELFLLESLCSQWNTEKRWIPRQFQSCWQFSPGSTDRQEDIAFEKSTESIYTAPCQIKLDTTRL